MAGITKCPTATPSRPCWPAARREALVEDRFVFAASTKVGHVVSVWKPLREMRAVVGVDFSFHDARRTFVTYATEYLDIDRAGVKALVNHASGDITDAYTIRQVEASRRRMLRIEDFILRAAARLTSAHAHEVASNDAR